MPLLAGESHLKDLAALVAANRHRHGKMPFHNLLDAAQPSAGGGTV